MHHQFHVDSLHDSYIDLQQQVALLIPSHRTPKGFISSYRASAFAPSGPILGDYKFLDIQSNPIFRCKSSALLLEIQIISAEACAFLAGASADNSLWQRMNVLSVMRQLFGKAEIVHFLFTMFDRKQVIHIPLCCSQEELSLHWLWKMCMPLASYRSQSLAFMTNV